MRSPPPAACRRANSSPRPLEAPVMSAVFFSSISIVIRCSSPYLWQGNFPSFSWQSMGMLREGRQISPPTKASRFPCRRPSEEGRILPFSRPAFPAGLQGVKFPYIRKFISVYTKKYFRICGNLFSCARKFLSFRTAQNFRSKGGEFFFGRRLDFLPQENLFPCGRKNIFLRKEIWASSERKFCAVRKERNFRAHEKKFPHMRKFFFVYTEINFLIYGNFTPCKPAGNAGREKRLFLPLRRGLRQVGDQAFLPYSTNETSPLSSSKLSGDA